MTAHYAINADRLRLRVLSDTVGFAPPYRMTADPGAIGVAGYEMTRGGWATTFGLYCSRARFAVSGRAVAFSHTVNVSIMADAGDVAVQGLAITTAVARKYWLRGDEYNLAVSGGELWKTLVASPGRIRVQGRNTADDDEEFYLGVADYPESWDAVVAAIGVKNFTEAQSRGILNNLVHETLKDQIETEQGKSLNTLVTELGPYDPT